MTPTPLSPNFIAALNNKSARFHGSLAGSILEAAEFKPQRARFLATGQTIVLMLEPCMTNDEAKALRKQAVNFLAGHSIHVSTSTITPQHQVLLMLHNPRYIG